MWDSLPGSFAFQAEMAAPCDLLLIAAVARFGLQGGASICRPEGRRVLEGCWRGSQRAKKQVPLFLEGGSSPKPWLLYSLALSLPRCAAVSP